MREGEGKLGKIKVSLRTVMWSGELLNQAGKGAGLKCTCTGRWVTDEEGELQQTAYILNGAPSDEAQIPKV